MSEALSDTADAQASSGDQPPENAQRLLLRFVAAHTFVTTNQAALLLGDQHEDPRPLLSELAGRGLIARTVGLRDHDPFAVTAAGLVELDSPMPVPQPRPRRYWRDFADAWLWAAAYRGVFGTNISGFYSRRQMQLLDTTPPANPDALAALSDRVRAKTADTRFAITPAGDSPDLHYPDITIVVAAGRVCFELALTAPGRERLEALLAGYRAKPNIAALIFMAETQPILDAVQTAADRAGIRELLHTQPMKLRREGPLQTS